MQENVSVFIDGSNLFHGMRKDHPGSFIDLEKLVAKLVGDRNLRRVYYYFAMPNQSDNGEAYQKQQKFINAISSLPYFKVIQGRLERRETTDKTGFVYVEKGVDIALAIDMISSLDTYETAILVSGDSDFAKVVEYIQQKGKHVEGYATESLMSFFLRKTLDVTKIIDKDFLVDCCLEKKAIDLSSTPFH